MQVLSKPRDRRFRDWEGSRVGKLKIGGYCGRGSGCSLWEYSCDCGRTGVISSASLLRGPVGCGCGRRSNKASVTHGMTETPEYEIWCGIKKRCLNQNSQFYKRYGGRGIAICDSWRDSFAAFYEFVGPRPSKSHTLDRINNDGNYEPGNVRWSTMKEQCRNRRSNCLIEVEGQVKTLVEWSEISGVSWGTIISRINRGWSPELAVFSKSWERKRGSSYA